MEDSWKIQSGSSGVGDHYILGLSEGFGWTLVEKTVTCTIFHSENLFVSLICVGKAHMFIHFRLESINFH